MLIPLNRLVGNHFGSVEGIGGFFQDKERSFRLGWFMILKRQSMVIQAQGSGLRPGSWGDGLLEKCEGLY